MRWQFPTRAAALPKLRAAHATYQKNTAI